MTRRSGAKDRRGTAMRLETIAVGGLAVALVGGLVGCESPESGETEAESVRTKSTTTSASESQKKTTSASESQKKTENQEISARSNSEDPDVGGGTVGSDECSEPPTCPEPSASKAPEVTCYEPASVAIGRKEEKSPESRQRGMKGPPKIKNTSAKLHIFGKHLVREDGPPVLVIYRPASKDGPGGQADTDLEVKSPVTSSPRWA